MPPGWPGGRGVLRTGHLAATRRPAAAAGPDPDTERAMVTEFEKTVGAPVWTERAGWAIRGSALLPWVDRHNCVSAATSFLSSPLCASQVRASRSVSLERRRRRRVGVAVPELNHVMTPSELLCQHETSARDSYGAGVLTMGRAPGWPAPRPETMWTAPRPGRHLRGTDGLSIGPAEGWRTGPLDRPAARRDVDRSTRTPGTRSRRGVRGSCSCRCGWPTAPAALAVPWPSCPAPRRRSPVHRRHHDCCRASVTPS